MKTILIEALERRRMMAALQPDPSFGKDGLATCALDGGGVMVAEVADGKVLAVGAITANSSMSVALNRLTASSLPDASFGTAGVVKSFTAKEVDGAVVRTDGKIVVVGKRSGGIFVACFTSQGDLDPTFDGDGIADLTFPIAGTPYITGMAAAPQGKIVLAGYIGCMTL